MKYIVIIPDGMFDHPVEVLENRTPLEVARTPNMDFMAKNGFCGLVQTIPDSLPPGSDVGNMAILGYDPEQCLTGRSALEAANMNIELKPDEVSFRCNLVTELDGKMADYSAGHIRTEEASILIDELNKEIQDPDVTFYAGKSYRHIVVIKTDNPDAYMGLKTVPPHDILDQSIESYLPKGDVALKILDLMERSRKIFDNHSVNIVRSDLGENPATMIWLWGQGTQPSLIPFKEKFGLSGSIISAVDLVNGIGRLAGLNVIDVPGATGYIDTNFEGKASYGLDSLNDQDYVYIHIEAPDEAGHLGDHRAKIEAIEKIDQHIVGEVLNRYSEHDDVRVLILPDHPTPVELRTHTREPVGFIMWGKGVAHNGLENYTEASCKEKGLKFKSGEAMIEHFIHRNL